MTKKTDGRQNNQPPKEHQFKKGKSGNPYGRPKKVSSTFQEELQAVFGKVRTIQIDGETREMTARHLILEQMMRKALQGDLQMIKACLPFLKHMDGAPDFEPLPEDKKALEDFVANYKPTGEPSDETE